MAHWDRRPRYGDVLETTIETISFRSGVGLGSITILIGPQREERTYEVAVRKAVPGDRVRVLVERCRKKRIEGRQIELITPSRKRISPNCSHFGLRENPGKGCGGCTLQSLSIPEQLQVKRARLRQLLDRAGLEKLDILTPIESVASWYYRNKMEFSFGDDHERRFSLGLFPTGYRREVIRLAECRLQSPESEQIVQAVRDWAQEKGLLPYKQHQDRGFLRTLTIREGKRTGQRLIILTTTAAEAAETSQGMRPAATILQEFSDFLSRWSTENDISLDSIYWTQHRTQRGEATTWTDHLLVGKATLQEELHIGPSRLTFSIHPRAFFQPNTLQAEVLYARIARAADGGLGFGGLRVLDLYCGTGTISLCMAAMGAQVVGVEIVAQAVENARENALRNGLDAQATFRCGDVGKVLAADQFSADVVIVDPPRAGLLPKTMDHLNAVRSGRLVYVSCNPLSMVRDIGLLSDNGWVASAIQPVDMFPHTAHIECVVSLTRDTAAAVSSGEAIDETLDQT
jgi:23S rRNA (uracil1939-C5)-methyltransferase